MHPNSDTTAAYRVKNETESVFFAILHHFISLNFIDPTIVYSVLPAKIEGVGEGIILGGASVHIKDFGSTLIPLQRQISTEGMGPPIP